MNLEEEAELRRKLIAIAKKCLQHKLMSVTWGNLSVRLGDDSVIITPSGVEKTALKPEDLLIVDLDGNVVKGRFRPSIETLMHVRIYRERSDVNAVIHTHSHYAMALAAMGIPIPVLTVEFAAAVGHEIPVTRFVMPGSAELAEEVAKALGKDKLVVLIRNHGVVAVGKEIEEAYHVAVLTEEEARTYFWVKLLEKEEASRIPQDKVKIIRSLFKEKYGQKERKAILDLGES